MINCPCPKKKDSSPAWNYKEFKIFKCNACGLEFTHPFVQGKVEYYKQHEIYNINKKNVNDSLPPKSIIESIISTTKIHSKSRLKILDYGCGFGGYSVVLKDLGHDVLSSDFNPSIVSFIKENYGLNSTTESYSDLKRKGLSFDLIILNQVLEHVDLLNELLIGLQNLLNKEGLLFISVPNKDYFKGVVSNKTLPSANYPPHHISFWSENSLKNILFTNGFELIYVKADKWPHEQDIYNKLSFIKPLILRSVITKLINIPMKVFMIKGPHLLALAKKNKYL